MFCVFDYLWKIKFTKISILPLHTIKFIKETHIFSMKKYRTKKTKHMLSKLMRFLIEQVLHL